MIDTKKDEMIDEEEWEEAVYDDNINPLQMLREIISFNQITADDLIHKMKKKYDEEPLTFPDFKKALLSLDNSLTLIQLKNIFN